MSKMFIQFKVPKQSLQTRKPISVCKNHNPEIKILLLYKKMEPNCDEFATI